MPVNWDDGYDPDLVLPRPRKPPKPRRRWPRAAARLRSWAQRLDPQPWMDRDSGTGAWVIHFPVGTGSVPLAGITTGTLAGYETGHAEAETEDG